VEPLSPQMRDALKRANPGVTDRDIDRSEEILAQLQDLDPGEEPELSAKLAREFGRIVKSRMPRYLEVTQAIAKAERFEALARVRSVPRIVRKPEA